LRQLEDRLVFKTDHSLLIEKDDVFDAAICLLAGADFLNGKCIHPDNLELAKKEGWIWVRDRDK
jgi:hypothetical protein